MAVISVTTISSEEQVVAGIPRTISITTNIAASIFYTLDGTNPTLFSPVYTSPIFLPTNQLEVILKIFATNGVDSSPIITELFETNMAQGTNARLPRSGTTANAQENLPGLYPYGNSPIQPNAGYENPADVGITVDNPAIASNSTGFNGEGSPNAFTDAPYDITNYSIKYSTTDFQNKPGYGIGTLPAQVKIQSDAPPPTTTDQNSDTFDPRALVIFQDERTEDPNSPAYINRMHLSLDNSEKTRDGNNFYTTGLDAPPVNGTFLRSHFNPRNNTITYYYLDTWSNRWIISTAAYTPSPNWDGNLSGMRSMRGGAGAKYVFEWQNFARRVLF